MRHTEEKSKLTLWVRRDSKKFGKQWAKKQHESLSQIVSDFLLRLKKIEEGFIEISPLVKRISGVIENKKATREDYRKHLEDKYLHG